MDVRVYLQNLQLSIPLTASNHRRRLVAIVTSHVEQRANQRRVFMTTIHALLMVTTITRVCHFLFTAADLRVLISAAFCLSHYIGNEANFSLR